jgi:hypothetical protein
VDARRIRAAARAVRERRVRHERCNRSPSGGLPVAKAHSPDVLVRNVFYLALAGVLIEIFVMAILPRIGS